MNLLEVFALQTYPVNKLNRGRLGELKSVTFGGIDRQRVSSQCRKSFIRDYMEKELGSEFFGDLSHHHGDTIMAMLENDKEFLESLNLTPEIFKLEAQKRIRSILAYTFGYFPKDEKEAKEDKKPAKGNKKGKKVTEVSEDEDGESSENSSDESESSGGDGNKETNKAAMVLLSRAEVQRMCDWVKQTWTDEAWKDVTGKETKMNQFKKDKKITLPARIAEFKAESYQDVSTAINIALFGRMLANRPEKSTDGAIQFAHDIGVQVLQREYDFYSAMDDLEAKGGAGMIGENEFTSNCLCRYGCVNLDLLAKNLNLNLDLTKRACISFIRAFLFVIPSGMNHSMASNTMPDYLRVSVRADSEPLNLMGAFERAIEVEDGDSIMGRAIGRAQKEAFIKEEVFGIPLASSTFVLNSFIDRDLDENKMLKEEVGKNVKNFDVLFQEVSDALNTIYKA